MTINPTHYKAPYTPHNSPVAMTMLPIQEEPTQPIYESDDDKPEGQGKSKPIAIPEKKTEKIWLNIYGEY